MKLSDGTSLKKATGNNTNSFYQVEKTPAPIVSEKATNVSPELKPAFVYGLPTEDGKTYTLVRQ